MERKICEIAFPYKHKAKTITKPKTFSIMHARN